MTTRRDAGGADPGRDPDPRDGAGPDRGQVVLLAAGVAAVALLACLVAYLGVVAGPGTGAADPGGDPAADVDRVVFGLAAAVDNASAGVSGEYRDREVVVDRAGAVLAADVAGVEAAGAAGGTAVRVRRNATAALAWARTDCPGGPDRAFGPCAVRNGLVVQERADRVHLVAVAFDVRLGDGRHRARLTAVVRPVRGVVRP